MRPPRNPNEGELTIDYLIELASAVRSIWPQRSADISPSISLNGATYRLARRGPSAAPSQPVRAFTAIRVSIPDEESGPPTIKLLVVKGTVNDLADGLGLTATGTSGTPPDNIWEFALSPSSEKYGVIKATLETDGTVSAAVFSLETTPSLTEAGDPETGDPPPFAYRKLFKVEVDGDYLITITQYTDGAQQAVVAVTDWSCSTITKIVFWLP